MSFWQRFSRFLKDDHAEPNASPDYLSAWGKIRAHLYDEIEAGNNDLAPLLNQVEIAARKFRDVKNYLRESLEPTELTLDRMMGQVTRIEAAVTTKLNRLLVSHQAQQIETTVTSLVEAISALDQVLATSFGTAEKSDADIQRMASQLADLTNRFT